MDKDTIEKNWSHFKIFFVFDVISAFFIFFVFSNYFFSESNFVVAIIVIKIFQVASLVAYGYFAYIFSKRRASLLIGLWKLVPMFGYIPLWLYMRSLMRQALLIPNATPIGVLQKSNAEKVSTLSRVKQEVTKTIHSLPTNPPTKLDKAVKISIITGVLIVGISVAFYYLYYLPNMHRQAENNKRECLDSVESIYKEKLEKSKKQYINNSLDNTETLVLMNTIKIINDNRIQARNECYK